MSYRSNGETIEVRYVALPDGRFDADAEGRTSDVIVMSASENAIDLEIDSLRRRFTVARRGETLFVHGPLGTAELIEVPRFASRAGDDTVGGCLAPMPGIVRQVMVGIGDRVEKGTVMVILEAMKMEHPLIANAPGIVKEVRVEVGQMVDPDFVMVVVEPEKP